MKLNLKIDVEHIKINFKPVVTTSKRAKKFHYIEFINSYISSCKLYKMFHEKLQSFAAIPKLKSIVE